MSNIHHYNTNKTHKKNTISDNKSKSYTQQNVTLSDTLLFFPEGFEHVFLAIYFMSLPYFAGLFFLFLYVANGDYNIFLSLDNANSYILTWAIGYEVLATIILLVIAKNAIRFSLQHTNGSIKKPFIIP